MSCEGITDTGIMVALENLKHLKKVEYQQKFSLLEILIMWCTNRSKSEKMLQFFKITEIKHVFPYGLMFLQNHLTALATMLPHLASLTLVTLDTTAAQLAQFPQLRRITLELEDYLGPGTLQLLTQLGPQLLEVSISCSSDPDTPLTLDQSAGPAGQQGQLFNAAVLAVGQLCPAVRQLSVSGLGLVSTAAVSQLRMEDRLHSSSWLRQQAWFSQLESLTLLSYEDSHPSMSVHSSLLQSVLVSARQLQRLHLEGYFTTFLTDAYMASVLHSNPLASLHTLSISVSDEGSTTARIPLSLRTVQALVATCSCVRELRLTDWSVAGEELQQVVARARENNWDLTLIKRD